MKRFMFAVATTAALAAPAAATDFTVVGQSSSISMNYAKIEWTSAGKMENGVVKFTCDRGAVSGAWIYAPRDVATGQASGKRMHKPFTIIKEWDRVSPSVSKGSWDLATIKTARMSGGGVSAMDDWSAIRVTGLDAACSPTSKVNYQDISVSK
ncbi:MAG: hypothetical protein ABIO85_04320 [Sphingomicrobium sp.]